MKPQAATFLRRNLFSVLCSIVIVVLAGGGWWLWHDLAKQEEILHLRTLDGEVELDTIASSPILREALAQTRTVVSRIEQNLVVDSNLADNLGYFYQLEERTQVRIRGLNQLTTSGPKEAGRTAYKAIPYSMEVSGTYEQVMNFLQGLESGPRLANIRSFSFRRSVAGSTTVVLQLDAALLGKS